MNFRKNQKKKDEKSLWEQMGRDTKTEEYPEEKSEWFSNLKKMISFSPARDHAEEEIERIRKKKKNL
jgi:hypothetical protein